MKEECLICMAPLEYLAADELMECAVCHKKIMSIRTQDRTYRRTEKKDNAFDKVLYGRHPEFIRAMEKASNEYNGLLDRMDADMEEGKCFVLAPSRPVGISRFEGDVEKIGALYELGRTDMEAEMDRLLAYLEQDS